MPAPLGNTNSLQVGSRSRRPALAVAALTRRYPGPCADCRRYARILRSKVKETHGTVSHDHEELINEAARHELAGRVWQYLIDTNPTMPPSKVADLLTKITQAAQCRRSCVSKLRLSGRPDGAADPWLVLDNAQHATRDAATSAVVPLAEASNDATRGDVVGDGGQGDD